VRLVQGLQALPSATFAHPDGGSSNAIAVVALRGPDPSESLIALDRQLLNDGNTGDLDLSRLPVAAFSSVNVTEGLGPEDSNGSNTFGGAINLVSLRPTRDAHAAFTLSGGSFGQSEGWINATGTQGRLGYAFAADDQNQSGYVNQPVLLNGTTRTTIGSSLASHAGLANLTWSFSQKADITARVFLLGDVRDQQRLERAFSGVSVVVHAAALKQVPACEYNPFEAVRTNVHGAENIVNYHRLMRDRDLSTTHTLINPQIDRSRPDAEAGAGEISLHKVGESSEGIIVRGARVNNLVSIMSGTPPVTGTSIGAAP